MNSVLKLTGHAATLLAAACGLAMSIQVVVAQAPAAGKTVPVLACDAGGIGGVALDADGAKPTILSVSTGKAGDVEYCLVKVLVPRAINIWVGLPMGGAWNGRWQSVGGGVYAGTVNAPTEALRSGYAAAATDTGHATGPISGIFGMLEPGKPNVELQTDFATRSLHMMAVVGKQLVKHFYGRDPAYSYWNGCSTGGRQGLRMAQDHPDDYDGILAAAPAIHWDRFQAAMLWPQVAAKRHNGGPVGGGERAAMSAKYRLATDRAVAACDANDGVTDGLLADPRRCGYSAAKDTSITQASCSASATNCRTPGEAKTIDDMWQGAVACRNGENCKAPAVASRKLGSKGNKRLWYGLPPGTDLGSLGGAAPFAVVTAQSRYWVYFDPEWDWRTVDHTNFIDYFRANVDKVGPMMGSDDPDLRDFRRSGSKLLIWHGWSDPLIVAEGSIDYYDRVVDRTGNLKRTQEFARLFMAPGVGHCAGGPGHQPQGAFDAVVSWVEKGIAPDTLPASRTVQGATQTRPLCPYPAVATWDGKGPEAEASSYSCKVSKK